MLTEEAHNGLVDNLIINRSKMYTTRHQKDNLFDGIRVVAARSAFRNSTSEAKDHEAFGLAHALRVLAVECSPFDWIDNRPESIKQQHIQEAQPYIPISYKDSKEYRRNTYTAYWSHQLPMDWVEYTDPDTGITEDKWMATRNSYSLALDEDTRDHYKWLANLYKMRSPAINGRTSITSMVSACLEAIGIAYLLPRPDYRELLDSSKNPRLARTNQNRNMHQKFGNHEHTPYIPGTWEVATKDWAQAYREQILKDDPTALERLEKIRANNNAT